MWTMEAVSYWWEIDRLVTWWPSSTLWRQWRWLWISERVQAHSTSSPCMSFCFLGTIISQDSSSRTLLSVPTLHLTLQLRFIHQLRVQLISALTLHFCSCERIHTKLNFNLQLHTSQLSPVLPLQLVRSSWAVVGGWRENACGQK